MQLDKIPLADVRSFSPFFLDYIQQKETLKPFYHRFPAIAAFKDQIKEKADAFPASSRRRLVEVLKKQYEGLTASEAVSHNIDKLSESNCFAITTGHQLNIFTGPAYFIYKIVTVINTCRDLKRAYPEHDFVPVYWMASEDHDYDEIKYFNLYGKRFSWNTDQSGAVGRFQTTGLSDLAKQVPGDVSLFLDAYTNCSKLSDAVRYYVNGLFGERGLVVLDADDRSLKSSISNLMEDDILQQTTKATVDQTNASLDKLGYKTQVYCRDINFFYLDDGVRSRIEKTTEGYKVLDTDFSFTESEIRRLISTQPEKFSPNVILRPLYEEIIVPNLAYVGGPAEVVYWLQLRGIFEAAGVPFPILMPRNFAMIVEHEVDRKRRKTGLDMSIFFEEKNFIFNHWVLNNAPEDLGVGTAREDLEQIFNRLRQRADAIDTTLAPMVNAEATRARKSIEKIKHKFLRAGKRRHSDKLRQIESVKDALFPNGSLQERTDNFLNFQQRNPAFIQQLLGSFDPFDFRFNIITYTS